MTSCSYVALIRKQDNTDYWVDIPDIPGCVSSGETADDAIRNFEDALAAHLRLLGQDTPPQTLPQPRSLKDVLATEEFPHFQAYMVDVDITPHLRLHFSRIGA